MWKIRGVGLRAQPSSEGRPLPVKPPCYAGGYPASFNVETIFSQVAGPSHLMTVVFVSAYASTDVTPSISPTSRLIAITQWPQEIVGIFTVFSSILSSSLSDEPYQTIRLNRCQKSCGVYFLGRHPWTLICQNACKIRRSFRIWVQYQAITLGRQ